MDTEVKVLYHFKDFILDPLRKSLWRDNELVSLTPKALETLIVLVKHKGAVVDKETLLNTVWADTFVEEATLAQNISILRKLLNTDSEKQVIENIPRRGYRFVLEVDEILSDEDFFVVEKYRQTKMVFSKSIENSDAGDLKTTAENNNDKHTSPDAISLETKKLSESSSTSVLKPKMILTLTGILFLAALGLGAWWLFQKPNEPKSRELSFKKLFSGNNAVFTAISPDGNYLALVNREAGNWSILLRQLNSEKIVPIFSSSETEIFGITFSKDSQTIFFTTYPKKPNQNGERFGNLFQLPKLGGTPVQLIQDIDSNISLSPDERKIVFVRNNYKEDKSSLVIADLETKEEKVLIARGIRGAFVRSGPAWSPDGKTIVCPAHNNAGVNTQMDIIAVDAQSGSARSFISHKFEWIGKTVWLNDGSGILFPGNSQNINDQIWKATFPEGETHLYTNSINGFLDLSITSNSNSFVTIQYIPSTNFWIQSVKESSAKPERIVNGFSELSSLPPGMTILPERRLILSLTKNNNTDIWQINLDSKEMNQLTSDTHKDFSPEVTPDGKFIFFLSNRDGISNIWRMKIDGTEVKQIYKSVINLVPGISSDGRFVFFSQRAGQDNYPSLWKIPVDGGEAVKVVDNYAINPQISPDGKWIACFYALKGNPLRLSIISVENGSLIKQFEIDNINSVQRMFWSSESNNIYFLKRFEGTSAIYRQPINSDQAVKVIETNSETIFRFTLSKNDDFIVYESGTFLQDVVLVESVK